MGNVSQTWLFIQFCQKMHPKVAAIWYCSYFWKHFLAKLNEKPCLTDIKYKKSHIAKLFYSLIQTLIYILFNKSQKKSLSFLEAEIWTLQYGILATYRFI